MKTSWNDGLVESEIRRVADSIGRFPSVSDLKGLGLNGLSCAMTRSGGFPAWRYKLGFPAAEHDSATGWLGESQMHSKLVQRGFTVTKPKEIKCPYDLLINGLVRIDVKTASYAEYGGCRGWFYRIGKYSQSDIIALFQLDAGDVYLLPWWQVPKTNVTICRGGGKYAGALNDYDLIQHTITALSAPRFGKLEAA